MIYPSVPHVVIAPESIPATGMSAASREVDLRAGDIVMLRSGGDEMTVLSVKGETVFASWDNQTSFGSCAPFERGDLVRLQAD